MTALAVMTIGVVYAQAPSCSESQAKEFIQNSAMKVLFRNGGDMFWDGESQARFIIPYEYGQPEVSSLFAGAMWMGAYDSGNNLRVAAQTYRANGNDFWAGPLEDATGTVYQNACTNFDRIWEVKRHNIEAHIADFDANGAINGVVHPTILQWPGKGNPQFAGEMGFSLPNQDLAPFYDRNNNGIYEPLLGDYPVFKHGDPTAIAAEILWSVFNDNGNLHTQSGGTPLIAEVQQTVYVFDCPNDPILNHTLFIKHKVINKGTLPLNDFYYGAWSDPDLGCYNDDYIGTVPSKNTVYTYNADYNDDNPCGTWGPLGYGQNPPVQALTFLNHSMEASIYHINNQSAQGDPQTPIHYYNLLQGLWRDGTPLTVGGSGYNPNDPSAVVTKYMFPNHPLNGQWSMTSASLSGLDQRWVTSIKQNVLAPGGVFEVDMAYSYHRDLDSNSFQNVSVMYDGVDHIQQLYNNNFSTVVCPAPVTCTANCIHPGDANDNGIANDFDVLLMGLYQGDILTTRANVTDDWAPQDPPVPLANGFADADGNGTINVADLDVNTTNFYKLHNNYTGAQEGYNTVGNDLWIDRWLSFLWPVTAPIIDPAGGKYISLDVYLGDSSNVINDVQGVTFRIDYDESVFEYRQTSTTTLGVTSASWLDDDGAGVYQRVTDQPGRMHYVATRLNQTGYSGQGRLGTISFWIHPNIPVSLNNLSTDICFSDFQAVRADGTHIPIGAGCYTLYFDTAGINVPIVKVEKEPLEVAIYPNPAQTKVTVDLGAIENVSIQLYDLLGNELYRTTHQDGLVVIDRGDLPSGVYLIAIQTTDGRLANRKIVFE